MNASSDRKRIEDAVLWVPQSRNQLCWMKGDLQSRSGTLLSFIASAGRGADERLLRSEEDRGRSAVGSAIAKPTLLDERGSAVSIWHSPFFHRKRGSRG